MQLTRPQYDFVAAQEQFPAMVAGFGSGKSHAAIWRSLYYKRKYPLCDVAYYLPTYDLVTRMAMPRFEETLLSIGARSRWFSCSLARSLCHRSQNCY